jgi:hypothetical protein
LKLTRNLFARIRKRAGGFIVLEKHVFVGQVGKRMQKSILTAAMKMAT